MRISISPRFSEVDVLGHVTNTALPVWFEHGRLPIFLQFGECENLRDLSLILRRYEIDFLRQIRASHDVEIETRIDAIGRSSLSIVQHAFQCGQEVASGRCVMVHFDYAANSPRAIDDTRRRALSIFFTDDYAQTLAMREPC